MENEKSMTLKIHNISDPQESMNQSSITPTSPDTPSVCCSPSANAGRSILVKQTSQKMNCLCSPTTHVGSFRCRYHRNSFNRGSRSFGSGISELASKATAAESSVGFSKSTNTIVGFSVNSDTTTASDTKVPLEG